MPVNRNTSTWCIGAASVLAIALGGCAGVEMRADAGQPCANHAFSIRDDFAGARRGECTVYSNGIVRLSIEPENAGPINDSAWYAFRIEPAAGGRAVIDLRYRGGHHRYVPKTSLDGKHWDPLPDTAVDVRRRGRNARLVVELGTDPVYVSAQELVMPDADSAWLDTLTSRAGISTLGESMGGRAIRALEWSGGSQDYVLLLGRQHPPEVSGAFAFKPFVETVLGDSALAQEFRQRFSVIAVPMLNPDGVIEGHWRNNLGGKDLNRDWGPFDQPETQLMRDLLDRQDAAGRRLRLLLDFHSTQRNLFYTQQDDDPLDPPGFATQWLDSARARLADYPFSQERRHNQGQPTAKNYVYQRYGIPAITYEVGDETDRALTAAAAVVFAEEMMRTLLETRH